MIKEVHFGERLREIRVQLFGSQRSLAQYLMQQGTLPKGDQSTINGYERRATFSRAIFERLTPIAKKGVNLDYLRRADVSDWHGTPIQELTEEMYMEVKESLLKLQLDHTRLQKLDDEMKGQNEQLHTRSDPGLRKEVEELRKELIDVLKENRALRERVTELEQEKNWGLDPDTSYQLK